MAASIRLYGAIRKSSEESPFPTWIDVQTIKFNRFDAQSEANITDSKIPNWAELHPVIRIAELRVEEIEESDV
jgi:hypothetical protein